MTPNPLFCDASRLVRSDLARTALRFYQNGWLFGTAGNLSARMPGDGDDRVVITASGRDKGELGDQDFVEVSLDGRLLQATQDRLPSAETDIHLALYRALDDVGAILHVHTPASTVLRRPQCAEFVFKDLEMLKGWGLHGESVSARLPVFKNHANVATIAAETEAHFARPREVPALLIEGHGITAWGATIQDARRHLEVTEFLCRLQSQPRS